jgi:activator of 2-hydroxyglutaryl-CoA dehydratase
VVRHLQRIIGKEILIHPLSEHWPALGAAYLMLKELQTDKPPTRVDLSRLLAEQGSLDYFYEPLQLPDSASQEIEIQEQYIHRPARTDHTAPVQVDIFRVPGEDPSGFYLGIDVGSTSTKALMLTGGGKPLCRLLYLYFRTAFESGAGPV